MEAQAPLLPTTTVAAATRPTTSPSTANIIARVATVLLVACVSLFAHHEASKGFDIAVVNSAASRGTLAGRRFDVFFVSNGRAARVLHYASRDVEQMLYPDESFPRRRVTRVTVQMAARNLTAQATVAAGVAPGEYVISLSPSLMSAADTAGAVTAAVRRAVARMWLWDGRGTAPAHILDSTVAYLADDEAAPEDGRCISARFLRLLESRQSGFVARLNRAMRDRWSDGAVDTALGAPARRECA